MINDDICKFEFLLRNGQTRLHCRAYLEAVIGGNEERVSADGLENGLLAVQHDALAVRAARLNRTEHYSIHTRVK